MKKYATMIIVFASLIGIFSLSSFYIALWKDDFNTDKWVLNGILSFIVAILVGIVGDSIRSSH